LKCFYPRATPGSPASVRWIEEKNQEFDYWMLKINFKLSQFELSYFLWFLCGYIFFVFKLNPDIVEEEKRIKNDKLLPVNMCASRNRLIYRYITVLYIQGIKCCSAKMHKCILWQLLKLQLCSKRRLLSLIRMKNIDTKSI